MRAALFFLGLLALANAQLLSVQAQETIQAGSSASFSLTGNFPSLTNVVSSFSVSSNATSTVTLTLSVSNLLSNLGNGVSSVNFAGGLSLNANGNSNGGNIFASANFNSNIASDLSGILSNLLPALASAVSLTITSSAPVQLTITGSTQGLAASGSLQVGLFTAYSVSTYGQTAAGNGAVYGTLPYSINANGQYSYTVNVPASSNGNGVVAFFKPFDPSQAKAATNGGTASTTGSSSFSTAGFVPAVFGYDHPLTGGIQYAFGHNIQVTPTASSGSQGTININNVGSFAGVNVGSGNNNGNSAGPSQTATTGLTFNNYYQISGSGGSNVLQWSTTPSDLTWSASSFTNASASGAVSNTNTVSGQAVAADAQTRGQLYSWYKSSTNAGATAAANSWNKVSSKSSASASAGLQVYTTTSSYSQWTVASSSANAIKVTFVTLIVALLVILF